MPLAIGIGIATALTQGVGGIVVAWILALGAWNDAGVWSDTDVWKDS